MHQQWKDVLSQLYFGALRRLLYSTIPFRRFPDAAEHSIVLYFTSSVGIQKYRALRLIEVISKAHFSCEWRKYLHSEKRIAHARALATTTTTAAECFYFECPLTRRRRARALTYGWNLRIESTGNIFLTCIEKRKEMKGHQAVVVVRKKWLQNIMRIWSH